LSFFFLSRFLRAEPDSLYGCGPRVIESVKRKSLNRKSLV